MNALWSELAFARATRGNAAAGDEAGQAESAANRGCESPGRRGLQPVPRLVHSSWMSFALKQQRELGRRSRAPASRAGK
jgi:hypothetical protein